MSPTDVRLRTAVLADVHGNLTALCAVLDDARRRGADRFVFLGDIVSFGPHPRECMDCIGGLPIAAAVRGNHDRYVAEGTFRSWPCPDTTPRVPAEIEEWTYSELTARQIETLRSWPPSASLDDDHHSLFCVHAALDSDERMVRPEQTDEQFAAELGTGGLRAYGHIHHQVMRTVAGSTYVNPGSVGLPFDRDPRAAYALVNDTAEGLAVDLLRVDYDVETVIRSLREREVPWGKVVAAVLRQSVSFFSPDLVIDS